MIFSTHWRYDKRKILFKELFGGFIQLYQNQTSNNNNNKWNIDVIKITDGWWEWERKRNTEGLETGEGRWFHSSFLICHLIIIIIFLPIMSCWLKNILIGFDYFNLLNNKKWLINTHVRLLKTSRACFFCFPILLLSLVSRSIKEMQRVNNRHMVVNKKWLKTISQQNFSFD